jgi:hypothetical protein
MSSPKRPSSQASTVFESAGPSRELTSLPSTSEKTDPWLVTFAPDDPENPLNWPRWKRWYITVAGGILVLNASVEPLHCASFFLPVHS